MRARVHSRGFTLLELGVVIGVIAILMSFSVTRMQGFRENAAFERIAKDLNGMCKVGVMYMERQGANIGAFTNIAAAASTRPALDELLPPGFTGLNPLNDQPYQIQVVNPMVTVRTQLPANSQYVATWDPSIVVNPPNCPGSCTVALTKRWLPPASMVPLLMEKRYLYRDCCCAGTCPCGPIPGWYCPGP
jgi:prepilin-type N-terminal cleavage/methylation domain-containing protein